VLCNLDTSSRVMLVGKQADGEGMPSDLGLRDGRFSCPEDRKGLTRGTHIEAVISR